MIKVRGYEPTALERRNRRNPQYRHISQQDIGISSSRHGHGEFSRYRRPISHRRTLNEGKRGIGAAVAKLDVFLSFIKGEDASSAVEYAVVLALIVAVCIVALTAVGEAAYDGLWEAVEALE